MTIFTTQYVAVVQFQFAVSGNRLSSVLAYGGAAPFDNALLHDLAQEFIAQVMPSIQAAQSQDVHYQALYLTNLKKETATPVTRPFTTEHGAVVQDSCPSNVAVCIRKNQHQVPSKSNGRVFFAGVPVTDITDGMLNNAALVGTWKTLADKLWLQLATGLGTYTPCIVSRRALAGFDVPYGVPFDETFVDSEIATQRRRTTELREAHA